MDYDSEEVRALKLYLEHGMPTYKRRSIYSRIRSQRMREARAKGTHTAADWEKILSETGYLCVRCGCEPVGRPCKDHIIPIYMGGSDAVDNLQPLCRECNTAKGPDCTNWMKSGIAAADVQNEDVEDAE